MFRYHVSQEDFTEMTIHLMKQKSAQTSSKIKLFLFTVFQMAMITYMIIKGQGVSPIIRVLMGAASLLWAGQTIFSYGFYNARAKMMLTNQKDKDPNGDFWKEHRLQLKNDKIDIGYGSQNASLECAQITGIDETENLTLLMSGSNIFEIVPKSVSERDSFKDFLEEIRATARRKLKEAQDKQRRDVLEQALFAEYLPLSEEEMIEKQVRMKRLSFLTPLGWSKITFIVFFVPLVILGFAIYNRSTLYIAIAAVFFFLTNAGTLMIFTKLYHNVVRKRLLPPGEEGYLLAVTEGKIHWFTREYHFQYDISEIKHVVTRKDASFYYFPNQEMLFVPASVRDEFYNALNSRRSLSDITQSMTPEEEEGEEEERPEE